MRKVLPNLKIPNTVPVKPGGLAAQLEKTGRLPPVTVLVTPLDPSIKPFELGGTTGFLTYNYSSSLLIPVDTFSFSLAAPDDPRPFNRIIREGDIMTVFANDRAIFSGIIDSTEVEVEATFGEKISVSGRDLIGQLEDHSVVDIDSAPIYFQSTSVQQIVGKLSQNTRIPGVRYQDVPSSQSIKFSAEPMETKLTALQRFLEPLNLLFWSDPLGRLVIGRPNMRQAPKGTFSLLKEKRFSNVQDMKVVRSAATIPNLVLPIWSGTEEVQNRLKSQGFPNNSAGPSRLFKLGHRVPRAVVVSLPDANTPQGASDINFLQAAGSNLLQAHAKREVARANQKEMIVQVNVASHYNESAEPFVADTTYRIQFDRGDVDEVMYCFQVDYSLSEDGGQQTSLYFCRLGSIVSDIRIP